jgi:SAM-dependent methyltransferase
MFHLQESDFMSNLKPPVPLYGASAHYQGQEGRAYFAAQAMTGRLSARWNLKFWQRYIGADDSVLDFGCGAGDLLSLLPATIKVGVEVNPAARAAAESQGIRTVAALTELRDAQFSRVISSHALEHVLAPLSTLEQLRLHIAEGGSLLLLLPLDDWRTPYQRRYHLDDLHRHLYTWTPQSLGNLLDEAGYKDIHVQIITDAMPPVLKLAVLFLKHELLRSWAGWGCSVLLRSRQLFAQAAP